MSVMEQELWQVVANPVAGGGRVGRERSQIQSRFHRAGIQFDWVETSAPLQAIKLVQTLIQQGVRRLAIVGGDGSLNEAVNGIMTQEIIPAHAISLAIIPAGTGGDFARMFGIRNIGQGIKVLKSYQLMALDAGLVRWQTGGKTLNRYFCNVAGLAFDAFVTATTADMNKAGWRGTATYLWAVLRNLWRYEQTEISLKFESQGWQKKAILANAGICRHNGGGMNLVPLADPADGLFDLSLVESLRPGQVLRHIAKLYNGNLYAHPLAHHRRSAWLEVESLTGLEVDGEYLGEGTGRLEIVPDALRLAIPKMPD